MSIQLLADKAVSNLPNNKADKFDPATIIIMVEIITTLLSALQNCREPEKAKEICNDPTFLQKRVVTLQVRKTMGLREFRQNGKNVINAVLKTGKDVTTEELATAYNEL
jgi:LDH2 family malate/lactate/ureidoglycolate dehydrogenase